MKIWLDDQINDPECPNRHTPDGWYGTSSVLEVARLVKEGKVTYISFDHDLGKPFFTGYLLARLIETWAFYGMVGRIEWDIHSANPVGRKNIQDAMVSANLSWSGERKKT
jgi:hypothetical protein